MAECPNTAKNAQGCTCACTRCPRHKVCCACIRYHREHGGLPACLKK